MLDPLAQEHPAVQPLAERLMELQFRSQEAARRRDGIAWRLDQIPERAAQREGEERQKLIERAEVLETELRESMVEAERLRLETLALEVELHLRRIEVVLEDPSRAKTLFDEYAAKLRAVGNPSTVDVPNLVEAILRAKRLYREGVLQGATEPSPELTEANERIGEQLAIYEREQQDRYALMRDYEPRLKHLLQPPTQKKRR